MSAWRRALRGGRQELRLHVMSTCSVCVAFICLTTALVVLTNLRALQLRWRDTGRASVYLRSEANHQDIQQIVSALRRTRGVTEVEHLPSDQARDELLETGDDLLAQLPKEAFPSSLEVKVHDPALEGSLAGLAERLRLLPSVEAVETYDTWGTRLDEVLEAALAVALLLGLIVLGTVTVVVSSTIRLSLQRRQVEVEVLKVVGATDAYVRRPFVIEGAVQGALGSIAALAFVAALYATIRVEVAGQLQLLLDSSLRFLPWYGPFALLGLGTSLGAVAAHVSVSRMLGHP